MTRSRVLSTLAVVVVLLLRWPGVFAASVVSHPPVSHHRNGGASVDSMVAAAHQRGRRELASAVTFSAALGTGNTIMLTFSAAVRGSGGGAVAPGDLSVTMHGGLARLSSFSITNTSTTSYTISLSLSGQPDGVEVVTVDVKAGKVKSAAGAAVVAQAPKQVTIDGVGYPNVAVLIPSKMYLAWLKRSGPGLGWVDCKLVLHANAWAGIAFNAWQMVGTRAIIGIPNNDVKLYDMDSRETSGVRLAAQQTLTGTSMAQSNGNTIVKWTMPTPAVNTSNMHVVFAYGSSNQLVTEVDNGATTLDFNAKPGCTVASSCNGHGTCNGTRCVCDLGYEDIDCGVCSPGFSRPNANRQGTCAADFMETGLQLTVADPSATFGTLGSATRDAFMAGFEAQVATALDIDRRLVLVISVRVSTGLVRMQLTTPQAWRRWVKPGNASAVPLDPATNVTCAELLSRLKAAVANGSSKLYNPGTYTRFAAAGQAITATYGTTLPPPVTGNTHTAELVPDKLNMEWVIGDDAVTIRLELTGIAWLSFGLNPRGTMVGADAVIGEPVARSVREYWLGAKDLPGVELQDSQDVYRQSMGQRDGKTVMEFTRLLDPRAAGKHSMQRRLSGGAIVPGFDNLPIAATGPTTIIYAWGTGNTLAYHGLENVGARHVDFGSGTVSLPGISGLNILHAVSMTLAWLVFIPAGVAVAMFGRRKEPRTGPRAWWFQRHQLIMYSGCLLVVVGFVASYNMVQGHHLATTHGVFGLCVACMAIVIPVLGMTRPHPGPGAKRKLWELVHKNGGRLSLVAAVPATVLGMLQLGLGTGWLVAYLLAVGMVVVAFGVGIVKRSRLKPLVRDPAHKRRATRRLSNVARIEGLATNFDDYGDHLVKDATPPGPRRNFAASGGGDAEESGPRKAAGSGAAASAAARGAGTEMVRLPGGKGMTHVINPVQHIDAATRGTRV